MLSDVSVIERARDWLAQDPDPDTRQELEALIDANDLEGLGSRFAGPLGFGTAGLRGLMGAGPNRMNRVNVIKTTHALCRWVDARVENAKDRGICIARDARHKSDVFVNDAIEVALGAGFRIYVYSKPVPTPLLAFALRDLGAAAGVMITASHNPPEYNGYKVFWENGAQIIPPNDEGIASRIDGAPRVDEVPRTAVSEAKESGQLVSMDRCARKYVTVVAEATCKTESRRTIQVAHTALHGVAYPLFRFLMSRTGFCKVATVREQARPDPTFPTIAFPNPEETGAMDRVIELASRIDARLALANDPDGDRLAVAARHGDHFVQLSGNELGILLADDLLSRSEGQGTPLVVSTVVSSPMLGRIAEARGARWEQTLTGHKWIQNRALALEQEGLRYVFGYEEALGYAGHRAIRDKDGVSAAMLIVDLASRLEAEGRTLIDALEALFDEHGYHDDRQISRWYEGASAQDDMDRALAALRANPPRSIGGREVRATHDFLRRVRTTEDGEVTDSSFAESNLLRFDLGDGHAAMIRPSGTEPKVKYYLYANAPRGTELAEARRLTQESLERMSRDLGIGRA
ncbi:MAG: phospho-sugar mutase [Myxococcota bacterium]